MAPKPRVLVVDDEQVIRSSFNRVLSENGYTVNAASDGRSALDRLQRESFDLAFVDLRMPGIPGMDVVRSIRSNQPKVQVVIITGYGTEEAAQTASELGVVDFVAKPLAPDDIKGLAGKAWARSKKGQTPARPEPKVEAPVVPKTPSAVVQPEPVPQPAEVRMPFWKGMALLLKGAILGLAYVIFLPLIGFGMLAWIIGGSAYKLFAGARVK